MDLAEDVMKSFLLPEMHFSDRSAGFEATARRFQSMLWGRRG